MKESKTIFNAEQRNIEQAKNILKDDNYNDNPLRQEYASLLSNYKKMFRQFRSLIRISDKQQNSLKDLNKKLEELNTSKDKFFSIISHDLRGPLASVIGIAEMLKEQIEDDAGKENIESLAGQVYSSAKNLYTLLENLLTWSRIQRGSIENYPENLELSETVDFVAGLFSVQAERKQIQLDISIPPGTMVYADYNVLNTVLRNLVSNAIKFTGGGGSVEISAMPRDEKTVAITVSDTGIGIRGDDLSNLFRIDVQYTRLGTAGEKGTGLGLILCRELVVKSGGEIWAESGVDSGTAFRFTLPAVLDKTKPANQRDEYVSEKAVRIFADDMVKYRMLVVDDASANRQILINLLRSLGFRCREASNGLEAIKIWETWKPHIVWMDIRMPIMNGYEAVKKIRSGDGGRRTTVIALTASISRDDFGEALKEGYDSIVPKPVKKFEIVNILRKYIGEYERKEKSLCSETGTEKKQMVIPDETKAFLPDIKKKLEMEIIPKWEEISEACYIDELADFAMEIKQFAINYHLGFLADYSRSLYECAQKNNINEIDRNMSVFPDYANRILDAAKEEELI